MPAYQKDTAENASDANEAPMDSARITREIAIERTTQERLLRVLPVTRWPSAEEAARMRWFSPITLGRSLRVNERTWVPAMVPWRATEDGFVTEHVIDWYRRFADGEPGVIVVEATGIRDIPSGPLLRIGDDRFIEGLSNLVAEVKRASSGRTRIFIQLIDFLAIKRRAPREKFLQRFLKVTPEVMARAADVLRLAPAEPRAVDETAFRELLCAQSDEVLRSILPERDIETMTMGYRERVTDTHLEHIRELPHVLPRLFAEAAKRAEKAGFDGVELHYAHAYTMASFLSALNTREDGYGGPPEHRVRLPLEVFEAVRSAVATEMVVGARFLGDEVIEGGNRIEDATFFAHEFARAGFDFLSISKGGKFEDAKQPREGEAAYPYTGQSGHECMPHVRMEDGTPFGRNIPLSARIRAELRSAGYSTPIVAAGGIASPWQAEEILQKGEADILASARQTLADPDWFKKVRQGHGDQVRRCFFTNYCEALDQAHKEVTCQRWDRTFGPNEKVPLTQDGKRRLTAPRWLPPGTDVS